MIKNLISGIAKASGNVAEVSQALYDRYVGAAELKQHFRRLPNTDAPANDIHRQVHPTRPRPTRASANTTDS